MPKNNSRANRERRQREAADRQKAYDALTPKRQLKALTARIGENGAVKQRAKLNKLVEA